VPRARDRFTANISLLFRELPYLDRPRAARAAGFSAVESWWPFPGPTATTAELDEFLAALSAAEVRLDALNFYAGDMAAGERGVANDPSRQDELSANLEQVVAIAEATGCRKFNLLVGNIDPGLEASTRRATAARSVRAAAERVARFGGTVLVEALSRAANPHYPFATGIEVVAFLDTELSDSPNAKLLFDTFHLGANGVDLVPAATELADWIGHVQLADAPGRGAPGSGTLPIRETLAALDAGGYSGALAAEYEPAERTAEDLGWIDTLLGDDPEPS